MLVLALGAALSLLAPPDTIGNLIILDDSLEARMTSLAERSPTFEAALREISLGHVPVTVGTLEQIHERTPTWMARQPMPGYAQVVPNAEDLSRSMMAQMITGGRGRGVRAAEVHVALDLENFRGTYLGLLADTATLRRDLDLVLAHEIAGHALGWSRSGLVEQGCGDPSWDEAMRGEIGCAVEVENRIRAEIGLPGRRDYADPPFFFPHWRGILLAYQFLKPTGPQPGEIVQRAYVVPAANPGAGPARLR